MTNNNTTITVMMWYQAIKIILLWRLLCLQKHGHTY